jgi:ADP-ribose pyrophosphatase
LQDKSGEAPLATARRELAEETGWQAERWDTLVDLRPSPGMSTESVRVYLAAGLSQQPREGEADGEEADLESRWISLPTAVREVLDGKVTNALAVAGILAADAAARVAAGGLRAVDAPWPGSSSSE